MNLKDGANEAVENVFHVAKKRELAARVLQ
jgi:hypothetical protein